MLVAPDVLIDTSRSLLYFDKVFLQPKAPYTFSSLGHPKERTHGRIGVIEDWWIPDRPEGPFDPLYLRTTCLEPCNGEEGSWLQKPLHISEEDLCQLLIIPGL